VDGAGPPGRHRGTELRLLVALFRGGPSGLLAFTAFLRAIAASWRALVPVVIARRHSTAAEMIRPSAARGCPGSQPSRATSSCRGRRRRSLPKRRCRATDVSIVMRLRQRAAMGGEVARRCCNVFLILRARRDHLLEPTLIELLAMRQHIGAPIAPPMLRAALISAEGWSVCPPAAPWARD